MPGQVRTPPQIQKTKHLSTSRPSAAASGAGYRYDARTSHHRAHAASSLMIPAASWAEGAITALYRGAWGQVSKNSLIVLANNLAIAPQVRAGFRSQGPTSDRRGAHGQRRRRRIAPARRAWSPDESAASVCSALAPPASRPPPLPKVPCGDVPCGAVPCPCVRKASSRVPAEAKRTTRTGRRWPRRWTRPLACP